MAEVFGVVASAVALLHLTAKGVRMVQSIPEIESDFKELCEEITNIDNWVKHAQVTIPSIATDLIKGQIKRTAERLESIARELEKVEGKLKSETIDGKVKVKKARWLIKADTITKLLQKARDAKQDLSLVTQCQQNAMLYHLSAVVSQGFTQNDQTFKAIVNHFMVLADKLPPSDVQPTESQRVEELPDSWTEAGMDKEGEKGVSIDGVSRENTCQQDWAIKKNPSHHLRKATRPAAALLQRAIRGCPDDCRCGCHAGPKRRRNEGWAGSLLGYLGVRYDLPWRGAGRDGRCRCRYSEQSWRVEYRPPPWLEARVWLLSGSLGTAGPVYSLRAVRLIPSSNIMWMRIEQSVFVMQGTIRNGDVVYPDDRDEMGEEVMEYIIRRDSYDVLEFLLVEWKNLLLEKGFSRRVAWAANEAIEALGSTPDEWQLELLQQVVSNSETGDEPATSRVHQAAKQGHGMAEALQVDGWARDALDGSGMAPLHWAARTGHAEAVKQLIGAGANVDVEGVYGQTPLVLAVMHYKMECARRLLDAGCRTDHTDMDGRTAMHLAASRGSVDMVRMLLSDDKARAAGANSRGRATAVATASFFGQLPLHDLARSAGTAEAVEEVARLLLDAHPSAINAKDRQGCTPLNLAVSFDNRPLLRCLIRAGASLATIDNNRRNLLHDIAWFSSPPTIDFLCEAAFAENMLPVIDHQLTDKWGGSPWDEFIWWIHAPPWQLNSARHAGARVQSAFAKLYRRIRDKNLHHDISVLKHALMALQEEHINAARDHLYGLANRKAGGQNDSAAACYRAFAKQLDAGEIDAATTALEQDLQDLQDDLLSSPWDQDSRYDYMASKRQWFEVSDTSFWVEPAAAFVRRHLHQGPGIEEQRDEPQFDNDQDETQTVSSDPSLDYDLITHIYSDRGDLLYDRETAPLFSPQTFFEQYGQNVDDQESEDDSGSEHDSGSEDDSGSEAGPVNNEILSSAQQDTVPYNTDPGGDGAQ